MSAMRDVTPITKESQLNPGEKVPCGCGCGAVGVLKKAPMKDGKRHAKIVCRCSRCIGRKNRTGGLQKQRMARRALGIPDAKFGTQLSNEESWRHPTFRCEVKSGQLARSVDTQYRKAAKQADANKAIGDARPLLFALMPAGSPSGYVMLQLATWQSVVVPLLAAVPE